MAKSHRSTLTKKQRKLEALRDKIYKEIDIHQGLVSGSIIVMDGQAGESSADSANIATGLRASFLELDSKIVKLIEFAEKHIK